MVDLARASKAELTQFAQTYGIAASKLKDCQQYLMKRASAPDGRFELHALTHASEPAPIRGLVLRFYRDESTTWVEPLREFPSEHLHTLTELLKLLEPV